MENRGLGEEANKEGDSNFSSYMSATPYNLAAYSYLQLNSGSVGIYTSELRQVYVTLRNATQLPFLHIYEYQNEWTVQNINTYLRKNVCANGDISLFISFSLLTFVTVLRFETVQIQTLGYFRDLL